MRTLPFFTTALLVSSPRSRPGARTPRPSRPLRGPGVAGSADGAALAATFNGPQGVAVDQYGSVFVADTSNLEIRKIAPVGTVTTFVRLAQPDYYGGPMTGVAVDSSGNI